MSTYVPISTITLTSNSSNVLFSGIPQIYTDLVLVYNARYTSTNTGQGLALRCNSDSGSNYSWTILEGNGSTTSSYRGSNTTSIAIGAVANGSQSSFGQGIVSLNNYSNTTSNKACIARQAGPSFLQIIAGSYRSTSPITSVSIFPSGTATNIASGSTFTLYGISAGTAKAMGGEVTISGGIAYHVFRQSGQFIPTENLTADILVIAGGGGGGASSASAGGGGAGGVVVHSSQSLLANTQYSAVVGAGGRGSTYASVATQVLAANGNNSQWASLTAAVGGGRGGSDGQAGGNGGSGGGGSTNGGAGGTGTSGQGFNGGTANVSGNFPAGGGGGAGSVGVSPASSGSNGGNGGSAVSSFTGWGSFSAMTTATGLGVSGAFAGGGGGGANSGSAGSGGGGGATAAATAGQSSAVSSNATANTGSGAGGGSNSGGYNVTQGAGASGVIVVRYTL